MSITSILPSLITSKNARTQWRCTPVAVMWSMLCCIGCYNSHSHPSVLLSALDAVRVDDIRSSNIGIVCWSSLSLSPASLIAVIVFSHHLHGEHVLPQTDPPSLTGVRAVYVLVVRACPPQQFQSTESLYGERGVCWLRSPFDRPNKSSIQ